jgi:hypothetical protein
MKQNLSKIETNLCFYENNGWKTSKIVNFDDKFSDFFLSTVYFLKQSKASKNRLNTYHVLVENIIFLT